jgi:group I intron endonuclease
VKLKPLNTPALYTIHNVLDVAERNKLYAKLRKTEELLGGIYAIQYKYNPNIFYIGRAFLFSNRLASHINNSLKDERLFTSNLFYNFVRAAGGWENFTFHIIEFLPKNRELQTERENFYFIKFNPILNTMTSGQCDSKKRLIKKELSMSDSKHNNSLELKNKHSRKPKLI